MNQIEALEFAKSLVSKLGFTPSAGSYAEDNFVFAFSTECGGPAVYGHSNCEIAGYLRNNVWQFFHKNNRIAWKHGPAGEAIVGIPA